MLNITPKGKVHVHWKVNPYDYSRDAEKEIVAKISKKYSISKDQIKVLPELVVLDETGGEIPLSSNIVDDIQDPAFQLSLFKEYLTLNKIEDYDFNIIKEIDDKINAQISYEVVDKNRRYTIKWVHWDNFLSYGADNFFDFTNLRQLVLLNGEPANQSGKTTFAIDLLHFLLFGNTDKVKTQEKIFNKHIPSATQVVVEGCINIEGTDYIIRRTLSRPQLSKRTSKSKTTQKVEYYKVVGSEKEELEEYIESQQEENTAKTNKLIKDAIGSEDDFDLMISVTESNLDELINKKDTERGRLLSRWIGLLPLEQKDVLAREEFNSNIKPYFISNQYDSETLKDEITAFNLVTESLNKENEALDKENEKLDGEIKKMEETARRLAGLRQSVDTSLSNINITTVEAKLQTLSEEGKKKGAILAGVEKELKEIGVVDFSVNAYDELVKELSDAATKKEVLAHKYRDLKEMISKLEKAEFCPTCGKKLDNVDNSEAIKKDKEELMRIVKDGKEIAEKVKELTEKVEKQKTLRDLNTKVNTLTVQKSALEANIATMRAEYTEQAGLKKEFLKNAEAIKKNNDLDIELRNNDVLLKGKREIKEKNVLAIRDKMNNIAQNQKEVKKREELLKKLKEEAILQRNWKIYLDMVGKHGIGKMVLRKALPVINAKICQLLTDVCDFDISVEINEKNDILFYLIKDGVKSDISSASGFERTAASLALRAVLAGISTMPKINCLILDEIWGRVAKENYDNLMRLIEKIGEDYDFIIMVSHLDHIKDSATTIITVTKEDNISRLKVA